MSQVSEPQAAAPVATVPGALPVVYFDGASSSRHVVQLWFGDGVAIVQDDRILATWAYGDMRRADSPAGILRVSCLTASPLARLDIRDWMIAADVVARCPRLDSDGAGPRAVCRIVGWSMAAALSIVAVILFGIPLAADRLTALVPDRVERHLGDIADGQLRSVLGDHVCTGPAGQAAFTRLVTAVRGAASLDGAADAVVRSSPTANALALPGGRIYLLKGLLAKAENPDEIAGVLAHELGHLKHRDGVRNMIHTGGTSFLLGLLFGDVTGSGAIIFASRMLVTSSYSREAEEAADTFAIDLMNRLGRSPKPLGDLLFRITGKQSEHSVGLLAGHPLTEDRLARMTRADARADGPTLLTPAEWTALKAICE